jgi:hypothetical protein
VTARNAPERHPDPETARLMDEVIGLLAAAYRDADRTGLRREARERGRAETDARMRSAALLLVRSAASGDGSGMHRALTQPQTTEDWKRLAVLLASAADAGKLEELSRQRLRAVS